MTIDYCFRYVAQAFKLCYHRSKYVLCNYIYILSVFQFDLFSVRLFYSLNTHCLTMSAIEIQILNSMEKQVKSCKFKIILPNPPVNYSVIFISRTHMCTILLADEKIKPCVSYLLRKYVHDETELIRQYEVYKVDSITRLADIVLGIICNIR